MVLPGRHKSNIMHTQFAENEIVQHSISVDGVVGANEIFMDPGNTLAFAGAIMHGSTKKVNSGQRGMSVYLWPYMGIFQSIG